MVLKAHVHRFTLSILIGLLPAAAPAADLSILGTYSSGSYGNTVDSTIQSTWLRFATGDRYQFRVAVPYMRIEATDVLVQPGLGAVPLSHGPGKGQGKTMGNGSDTTADLADDGSTTSVTSSTTSGLGDVWLSGFVRVLGGNAKVYRMDTGLEVKAPTADEEQLLGTGELDYRFIVSGEYRFWTALTFSTLGWNQLGDPEWIELNDAFDLVIGAESEPLWERIIVTGWFEGNQEVVDATGDRAAVGIGCRSTGRFRWRVLATAGLSGAAEDFSVAFGLSIGIEPPKTGVGGIGL